MPNSDNHLNVMQRMNQKLRSNVSFSIENSFSNSYFPNRISVDTDTQSSLTPTSSNAMNSPVMNAVSSPSSSPLLPPMSSMINRNLSLIPTSPQSTSNNNKRKSSTPSTNPNRFDGTTEEELSQRLLSDILQTNLDIVFVCLVFFF